ncbi:MAG: ectonucleotide pyrophosphatase/phosphodiesterase [Chitinophagaceae bacterium]
MKMVFIVLTTIMQVITGFSQPAKHVVLITIDGSRPDFYLDSSWHAINIRGLMKDGAYAMGVNSVFPTMTYPSHTTIVTGVQPVKHGVYYNSMFEPMGSTGKIYWNDSSIKKPTIWGAAQKKGLKVAALFWPVAADAPVMYNIPDIDKMGEVVREKYSKPAGIVQELKKNVFKDTSRINYGPDTNNAKIAAYIIKKDKPNLMTIHFFYVDHSEHMSGRDGDSVRVSVKNADKGVGIIINALKAAGIWDQTVLIITGDHGFKDVTAGVNPNVWLVKAGLITDVKTNDWKAQFFSVGGSTYLYLKDRKDLKTLARVHEIHNGLPENEKKLFRIVDRKELNSIGANPEVELALTSMNGASFGNAFFGDAVRPGRGGAHGHFPDSKEIQTGFVAHGPGIKKGTMIPVMNLRDIAPIIAKLLGFPFPSADGKIPTGLME